MRSVGRSVRDVFAFFFDFLCFRSESDEEAEDTLRERALAFFLDGLDGRSEPDEEEDALRFLGFFFSLLPLSSFNRRRAGMSFQPFCLKSQRKSPGGRLSESDEINYI